MKVLIYGSREFARVVRELVCDCGHAPAGFIDDMHAGGEVIGPWAEVAKKHSSADHAVVIAVGYRDLPARWAVYQRVADAGFQIPTLIHPRGYVARTATVHPGAMVMAGAHVDAHAIVGEGCVLWPGCVVNHDCEIGANTFLSPGAVICGSTRIGRNCFVGAGAVVVDHRVVCDGAFIKAGVVFKESPANDQP